MNFSAIHYFFLFCSSMATGVPLMESAFPPAASPYLKAAAAVFGLLALVSGAFAPSVSDTQTLKAAAKLGATRVAGALVMVGALAVVLSACAAFQSAMPYLPRPNDLACAANDIERGIENPITIVSDCPGLAQVAAADLEALVMNLLMAKRAAHRASAEHTAVACDGGADGGT